MWLWKNCSADSLGLSFPTFEMEIINIIQWCVCALSIAKWCPTLYNPMDWSPPGTSVHGILQATRLDWVAMPSSRASSQPRDWTRLSYDSCIGRQILYHWRHQGSPNTVVVKWKRSVFIPIPKKGNAKEYSNYCTIALILHTSKAVLKILQARLQ